MVAIILEAMPEGLQMHLEERARRHRRSVDREVIAILEQAMAAMPAAPAENVASASPTKHASRLPLPAFHSGTQLPAGFDLPNTVRALEAASDADLATLIIPGVCR